MAPKFRESRPLKRSKTAKIKPNIRIYAFCEGEKTEPDFLEEYKNIYGNQLVDIFQSVAQGVPKTIVENAIDKKKDLDRAARKSNDPLEKCFEVWAIFDRDEHPDIPTAFQKAKKHNIEVAFSNPCFEIWALNHYKHQTAEIHRHKAQSELGKYIKGYNCKSNKAVSAKELEDLNIYKDVVKRFEKLSTEHEKCNISIIDRNPYTDIYKLLDKIKNNGKAKKI